MLKRSFWPVSQSIDIVKASLEQTATAVESEIRRYSDNERNIKSEKVRILSLEDLSNCFPYYNNIPTLFLIVPFSPSWTYILYNTFLCDGYDSLMHNLTRLFGFDTIHVSSHDRQTTFLPGNGFSYRRVVNAEIVKRELSCSIEDRGRWAFFESGPRQDWEDGNDYTLKVKKKRLNEEIIESMLEKIGVNIYSDNSHGLPIDAVLVSRPEIVKTLPTRTKKEVLRNYEES